MVKEKTPKTPQSKTNVIPASESDNKQCLQLFPFYFLPANKNFEEFENIYGSLGEPKKKEVLTPQDKHDAGFVETGTKNNPANPRDYKFGEALVPDDKLKGEQPGQGGHFSEVDDRYNKNKEPAPNAQTAKGSPSRFKKWAKRAVVGLAATALISTGIGYCRGEKVCYDITNKKVATMCYAQQTPGLNRIDFIQNSNLINNHNRMYAAKNETLDKKFLAQFSEEEKNLSAIPVSYEAQDVPKEAEQVKETTGFPQVTGKVVKKKEKITTSGYAVRHPGIEEMGLSLHFEGGKLYYLVNSDVLEFSKSDGRGLEAIVYAPDEFNLAPLKAEFNECGLSSIDLGKDAGKYQLAAVALKQAPTSPVDRVEGQGLIIASSRFDTNIQDKNIQTQLEKGYECITPKDKEQLEGVIGEVAENTAPAMFNALDIRKAKIGEPFEAYAFAIDKEDSASIVVRGIPGRDDNKKYNFGTESADVDINTIPPLAEIVRANKVVVSSYRVISENPIKDDFVTGLCALDQNHEDISVEKQCSDYAVTFDKEDGKATVSVVSAQEQGPDVIAKEKVSSAAHGKRRVHSIWDAWSPSQSRSTITEETITEGQPIGLEETVVVAGTAAKAQEDGFEMQLRRRFPLRNQNYIDLEKAVKNPDELRRFYIPEENYGRGYVVHMLNADQNQDKKIVFTNYFEDGTSVSKLLKINRHGSVKIKKRMLEGAVSTIEDPVSHDLLAVKNVDGKLQAYYIYDSSETVVPYDTLDENKDASTELPEGDYGLRPSAERFMHDNYMVKVSLNGEERTSNEDEVEFSLKGGDELNIKTEGHSPPERAYYNEIKIKVEKNREEKQTEESKKTQEVKEDAPKVSLSRETRLPKVSYEAGVSLSDNSGKVESSAWENEYQESGYEGNIDVSYLIKDALRLGITTRFGQSESDIDNIGEADTTTLSIGGYGDLRLDKNQTNLRLFGLYDRTNEKSKIELLGSNIEQDAITDRMLGDVQLDVNGLGIEALGSYKLYLLTQDNPSVDERGADSDVVLAPFFRYGDSVIQAYLHQYGRYSIQLQEELKGLSAGLAGAYTPKSDRLSGFAFAGFPVSDEDMQAYNFGAGLSFRPLKDKNFYLNLAGEFDQETYNQGSDEIMNQGSSVGLSVSNRNLIDLRPYLTNLLH